MEKDILQNYYEAFINEKDKRDFFAGLKNYVNFVLSDDECKKIITGIKTSKKDIFDEKMKLENLTTEEARASRLKFNETKDSLRKIGIKIPIKTEKSNPIADKMLYSQSYSKIKEKEKEIKNGRKFSLWGAWDKINSFHYAFRINLPNKEPIIEYRPLVALFHKHLMQKLAGNKNLPDSGMATKLEDTTIQEEKIGDGSQEVKSITIVVDNPGGSCKTIWLVFNNDFQNKVKFSVKGKRDNNESSYIMTLYEIRDRGQITYDKQMLTTINSKIFARKEIKDKYKQATIVEKGDDGYFRMNDKIKTTIKRKDMLTPEQLNYFPVDLKRYSMQSESNWKKKNRFSD